MVGKVVDSLDNLLVFAGLFSSVLTSFVAQTSQSSKDNAAAIISPLVELIAVRCTSSAGGSLSDIAPAFARTVVWVNALWFTSLALSLASALLAVLSKQWLRQYLSFISGTARERALIRQFRYNAMEKWAVRTIIGLLPTLLHLALGLFLVGLVVFLAPLHRGIAASVGIISAALFVAYIASIVVAIVYVASPYRTTFSDILSTSLRWMFTAAYPFFQDKLALRGVRIGPTARAAEQALEVFVEKDSGDRQACNALRWLLSTTRSTSTKTLIMNSLDAFPAGFFDEDVQQAIFAQLSNGCGPDYGVVRNWSNNLPQRTADDSELMLGILTHSNSAKYPSIDVRDKEHLPKSDTELAIAYAALNFTRIRHDSPDEGRDAKLTVLRALFPARASDIPLDFSSYSRILESLGSTSPVIWACLADRGPWLANLSPRELDNWPSREVDLRAYLDLINAAGHAKRYDEWSVFQSPVGLLSFLEPVFDELGWYDCSPGPAERCHWAVTPLFKHVGNNKDDNDLMGDSPPPDEDAVWEPAVYPTEWPPLPAPTWAQAWEAADVEKKVQEAETDAEMEAEEEKKARKEREGGRGAFGSGIRKLVHETLRGRGEAARRDIEMQEM